MSKHFRLPFHGTVDFAAAHDKVVLAVLVGANKVVRSIVTWVFVGRAEAVRL